MDAGQPHAHDTIRGVFCSVDTFVGRMSYELSSERRGTARRISSSATATAFAAKR